MIIHRLQKAASEPKVRDTMDIEDEILEELENLERTIKKKDQIILNRASVQQIAHQCFLDELYLAVRAEPRVKKRGRHNNSFSLFVHT